MDLRLRSGRSSCSWRCWKKKHKTMRSWLLPSWWFAQPLKMSSSREHVTSGRRCAAFHCKLQDKQSRGLSEDHSVLCMGKTCRLRPFWQLPRSTITITRFRGQPLFPKLLLRLEGFHFSILWKRRNAMMESMISLYHTTTCKSTGIGRKPACISASTHK